MTMETRKIQALLAALVNKGSILVTLLLSFLLLKEPFTPRITFGVVLILAGVITSTS